MSPLDRPVPPPGEEIHIPGPSAQPLLLAIGITVALVGLTTHVILLVAGLVLTVGVSAVWIRDAVREYRQLPLEHHVPTQASAPASERESGGSGH
jgi:hypothetical protein